MTKQKRYAVTGAFGYSGKYITKILLKQGHEVITITGNPNRPDPFNGQVKAYPFYFDHPDKLVKVLKGVDTLINTYWVRFDYKDKSYQMAVTNSKILFRAAKEAGVKRLVHVSITNPTLESHLPYFSGKATLEEELKRSGLSYAILRPTVIFGREDILINNIAWFLRHFPFFPIPGDGKYKIQPIYVEDLAKLAVEVSQKNEDLIIDAIGPETYTFNEISLMIKTAIKSRSVILNVPPKIAYFLSSIIGKFVGDVVLTREEVKGLMDDLLVTDSPPVGETKLSDWVSENRGSLGTRYANELNRHYKKQTGEQAKKLGGTLNERE